VFYRFNRNRALQQLQEISYTQEQNQETSYAQAQLQKTSIKQHYKEICLRLNT